MRSSSEITILLNKEKEIPSVTPRDLLKNSENVNKTLHIRKIQQKVERFKLLLCCLLWENMLQCE